MTMATDICEALRRHDRELRQRLSIRAGDGAEIEEGSDAWLLVEALCGAPEEECLARFAASGRSLAEQGGRLEVRLSSIERWHTALDEAIGELFAGDPALMAQAATRLGRLATRIVTTLAREYQAAKLRQADEEAERAHRGMTRLQALQRINAATNSTLDLDQTLATAAEAVAEEMHADLCVIFLFDEVSRELELRATNGPYPRHSRHYTLQLGRGYTGWVAEHGHPLIVADAMADGRFVLEAGAYEMPFSGLLSVPIIFFTGVKLEGVISVQSRTPRTFTDDEVDFLEIVAGQLAMNIENGRLYEQTDEELRRKVHELSTLHRVSGLVTSTLVLDNVLRIIVSQAVQLSGADRSVLFELDPATQRLRAVASHGFEGFDLARATVRQGQCCAGCTVSTAEPLARIDCMRTDPGCFLHDIPEAVDDQHSVLTVPLSTVHGPLGALCVFSSQRRTLDAHQVQLVTTFANVAAIAMENARLFTATQQGLRTREVLLREMHHRVKNNLQQVASILNMHRRRTKSPEVQQILLENVDRIQGIAATHDLLSNANTQLGVAPVDEIARKIVGIVRGNLVPPELKVRFFVGPAPFHIPTEQATTLAIILNELIANAIEHGYEGRTHGEIRVTGGQEDHHLALVVADDGVGLPEGFSLRTNEGLGLQLVRNLVENNLHGSVSLRRITGDPDLPGTPKEAVERVTNPKLNAVRPDAQEANHEAEEGRAWTVAELRFPRPPADDTALRAQALAADLT
jgi:two-component system, sensor histidine kinase PdtaS